MGGFGDEPGGVAVVDDCSTVFEVSFGGHDQEFGGGAWGEGGEFLGCDGVQPGAPVWACDGDDVEVGLVHDGLSAFQGTLFGHWVTVMPGDSGVGSCCGDSSGPRQEWAAPLGGFCGCGGFSHGLPGSELQKRKTAGGDRRRPGSAPT